MRIILASLAFFAPLAVAATLLLGGCDGGHGGTPVSSPTLTQGQWDTPNLGPPTSSSVDRHELGVDAALPPPPR